MEQILYQPENKQLSEYDKAQCAIGKFACRVVLAVNPGNPDWHQEAIAKFSDEQENKHAQRALDAFSLSIEPNAAYLSGFGRAQELVSRLLPFFDTKLDGIKRIPLPEKVTLGPAQFTEEGLKTHINQDLRGLQLLLYAMRKFNYLYREFGLDKQEQLMVQGALDAMEIYQRAATAYSRFRLN